MTSMYDPGGVAYADEADVRDEMTRVFDVCHGCQRCVSFCSTFPTLFEMIDEHEDRDAGLLTPAQQDHVTEQCVQCSACAVGCPYAPGTQDVQLDFPRLMLRARAMQHRHGHMPARSKVAARVIGRADAVGKLATTFPSLANRVAGARPGSLTRRLAAMLTGVSARRRLPAYASERFSRWFARRPGVEAGGRRAVTVFPTCVVEYQATAVGKDLVRVYERNGVSCSVSSAGCCGAPSLHAGDLKRFARIAETNVATLADDIRDGADVVVPEPLCRSVVRDHYPDHVDDKQHADADLVARHTVDAVEYLMNLHHEDDAVLDTNFSRDVPATITYHPSCRSQHHGLAGRDLMWLTGASVSVVQECSGAESPWDLRVENDDVSMSTGERLGDAIAAADGDVVAGDGHISNLAITEQTGRPVLHPIEIVARAYGIPEEH